MLTELPDIIDPIRLAQKGLVRQGFVKISALPLLAEMLLAESETQAEAEVKGFQDVHKRCIIEGQVHAQVHISCQRCLQPLSLALRGDFKLCVVQTEAQAEAVAEDCDPWMLEAQGLSLWQMVEESLILALPDAPKHAENICQLSNDFSDSV